MPQERNTFRLGLTGMVMLGLLFAVLMFLSGQGWGRTTELVTVRFPHHIMLPVLKPGSAVFCGASQVGQIKRVWFGGGDPAGSAGAEDPLYVYLQAAVDTAVGLREDCQIIAKGPLLGGSGMLVIKNRGVSAVRVDRGTVVEGEEAGSLGAIMESLAGELDPDSPRSLLATLKTQLDPQEASSLMAKVHYSLRDINQITARMSLELDPGERGLLLARLHSILGNINKATALLKEELEPGREAALMYGVHQAIDQVNQGLAEAVGMLEENREPLRSTLGELEATARTVNREIVAQLAAEMDPEREGTMLAGVHRALDQVNASLDNLQVVSDSAKEMVLLNKHNINAAMTNLRVSTGYLKGGIRYVIANPWLLLKPPADKDSPERQAAQVAREFTEAASRLDAAMGHLRAVLELQGPETRPDDPKLLEARQQLEEVRASFREKEAILWEMIK